MGSTWCSRRGMVVELVWGPTWRVVILVVDLVPDLAWLCMSIHEGGEGAGTHRGRRCQVRDGGGSRRRRRRRGGGGGKGKTDGLQLNCVPRFGHARAALSDSHAPTLYYQTKREVRAPWLYINIRGVVLFSPIF